MDLGTEGRLKGTCPGQAPLRQPKKSGFFGKYDTSRPFVCW
ncbi:hypothetical protein [Streptomyces sp. NBC_00258]|nr:hypothetical protein [Streptomyces sp. NBC_00258]